jgi:hypothetical protein
MLVIIYPSVILCDTQKVAVFAISVAFRWLTI